MGSLRRKVVQVKLVSAGVWKSKWCPDKSIKILDRIDVQRMFPLVE